MPDLGDRSPDAAASPSEDAAPLVLAGFWDGDSRLYLSRERNHYVQFRLEDVREVGYIAPGHNPLLGEQAPGVALEPGASVEFVRTGPATPDDEFAFEARLRGSAGDL